MEIQCRYVVHNNKGIETKCKLTGIGSLGVQRNQNLWSCDDRKGSLPEDQHF